MWQFETDIVKSQDQSGRSHWETTNSWNLRDADLCLQGSTSNKRPYNLAIRAATVSAAVLLTFPVTLTAQAQISEPTVSTPFTVNNATQTPIEGVGHDYLHDLSETVNPQNGQVSIRIAGPTPEERGLHFPTYALMYDTSGRFAMGGQISFGSCQTVGSSVPVCIERVDAPVWANVNTMIPIAPTVLGIDKEYANPQVNISLDEGQEDGTKTCNFIGPYVYEDPNGGFHNINLLTQQSGTDCATLGIAVGGNVGWDPQFIFANGTIGDLHGDIFNGDNLATAEDTNGNFRNGTGRPWGVTTTNGGAYPSSVTIPGTADPSSNQALPYSYEYASYPINFNSGLTVKLHPASTSNCYAGSALPSGPTSFTDVHKLDLPNGQSYTFGYESQWGLVNSITYPTGATVSYTWGVNSDSESIVVLTPAYDTVIIQNQGSSNGVQTCYFEQDLPAVQTRVVSYDGTTPALEQDFSYGTVWNNYGTWSSKRTTVVTKDLIRPGNPSTITIYNYLPYNTPAIAGLPNQSYVAQEDTIQYEDGSGNVLRTVKKVWSAISQLRAECDITDTGLVSGKFYQYQAVPNYGPSNLVSDVAEYDYTQNVPAGCTQPSTTPARETKTQYASLPSSSLWKGGAIPQINDRPSVIQLYDHGTLLSETDIQYDQTSIQSVSPQAYGHDEAHYNASQVTTRGNATTITRKCFQNCTCPNPNNCSTTTVKYDDTGQIVQVTDPNGNTTSLTYTDQFDSGGSPPTDPATGQAGNTNTYVTQINRPTTNGVQHISTFKYHYMFGELDYAKDENLNFTTYVYDDLWGRPTQANYPDGGQTQTLYEDAGPNPSVTKTVAETSSLNVTTTTVEDGAGHPIKSFVSTDHPAGQIETYTVYDGMGRVYSVSNPYISTTDPTYGITTFTYDALGRKTQRTNPDQTSAHWCYDQNSSNNHAQCNPQRSCVPGPWTDYADESGNDHQTTTDAFGRLVTVDEPNGASQTPSMETDYSYDAGNNLTAVSQWGSTQDSCKGGAPRSRSFAYDSLSRLTSATNPESGTVGYTYDANGNVYTKTDARSIVTTFGYDALNRLQSKTYSSNDASATPYSCYQYDSSSVTFGMGRLSNEWTQPRSSRQCASTAPSTGYLTLRSILAYDKMGRLWTDQQCTSAGCNKATPCQTSSNGNQSYGYDLAGNVTCSSNGIASTPGLSGAPLTFASSFDAGGHLSGTTSNWTTFPTSLFTLQNYGPAGPTSWVLGQNLNLLQSFNPRLWVQSFSAVGQTP